MIPSPVQPSSASHPSALVPRLPLPSLLIPLPAAVPLARTCLSAPILLSSRAPSAPASPPPLPASPPPAPRPPPVACVRRGGSGQIRRAGKRVSVTLRGSRRACHRRRPTACPSIRLLPLRRERLLPGAAPALHRLVDAGQTPVLAVLALRPVPAAFEFAPCKFPSQNIITSALPQS